MSGISSATAMLIAGGGSSLASGVGKYEQGQQQKQAYDYNAAVTTINTDNQMVANKQKFTELVGRQGSAYAASGVDLTSGSPLLIMAATQARGAQEDEQIKQSGDEQANLQRYYGKMAAFSGTVNGIGSFLSGFTSDISTFGKLTNNPTPSAGGDSAPGF